jgi:hypothetical protein
MVMPKQRGTDKWERVRRLRYAELIRLLRDRWGHTLPNDDAGREDLWELVTNVSLAVAGAYKKMRGVIEVWAPWMDADEAATMIEHVNTLTIYERTPTREQLGERLRVTNDERERLKLWQFKPVDMTEADLVEHRKKVKNERRRARRQAQGAKPRHAYLAKSLSKQKPWEAEGIARATWYRRRSQTGETSVVRTIVIKEGPHLSHGKGYQGEPVVGLSQTTEAHGRVISPSSPGLGPHLSHGPDPVSLKRVAKKNRVGADRTFKPQGKERAKCL